MLNCEDPNTNTRICHHYFVRLIPRSYQNYLSFKRLACIEHTK